MSFFSRANWWKHYSHPQCDSFVFLTQFNNNFEKIKYVEKVFEKQHSLNTTAIGNNNCFKSHFPIKSIDNYKSQFKFLWISNSQELNSRYNSQEKRGHRGHTRALFWTHSILLERSQRDNSNHSMKDHQTWSWFVRGFVHS